MRVVKQGTINYPVYEGSKSGGGCFVATAVYEDSTHPDVIVLRTFRDEVLSSSSYGKKFIEWYYNNGPRYAAYISSKLFIKKLLRLYVFPVIIFIISTIKK